MIVENSGTPPGRLQLQPLLEALRIEGQWWRVLLADIPGDTNPRKQNYIYSAARHGLFRVKTHIVDQHLFVMRVPSTTSTS